MEKSNKLKTKEHEFNVDVEDEDNNYGNIFPGYEKTVNSAVKVLLKDFDEELETLLGKDIEDMDIWYSPYIWALRLFLIIIFCLVELQGILH